MSASTLHYVQLLLFHGRTVITLYSKALFFVKTVYSPAVINESCVEVAALSASSAETTMN